MSPPDVAALPELLAPLRWYLFVGLPLGLLTGGALSLVAASPTGWGGYGSESRRAARLGHVATVMLPALGALYELQLRSAAELPAWTSTVAWLWIAGGVSLCLSLFLTAARPSWKAVLVLPATVVIVAACGLGAAAVLGGVA